MSEYDLEKVYERARHRCREKRESWRWGEAAFDPLTGKDKIPNGIPNARAIALTTGE